MIIMRRQTGAVLYTLSSLVLFISFLFGAVLFSAEAGKAAVRYVKPRGEAVVRTGQGNEYKIVAMVKDGVSVELLEENDSYSLIKLSNGVEGWILKRFLSVEPPLSDAVAVLRKEKEELQQQEIAATQKVEAMSAMLSRAKTDIDALTAERDKIRVDYQTLQRDTADVVKIKNDLERTAEENGKLVEKLVALEQENAKLKKDKSVNWFLAGAGVLLAGMLLGRMPSPSRKRKSSLLS